MADVIKKDLPHRTTANCQLCKVTGAQERDTAQGQKQNVGRVTRLAARDVSGQEEVWAQVRNSWQGEQAQPRPKEHRNESSCNADLAGCRGRTESEISKVSRGTLISNDGEEFSKDCRLKPNDGVAIWSLLLFPQLEPTEDVHPSHGRECCQFITQLLQHP